MQAHIQVKNRDQMYSTNGGKDIMKIANEVYENKILFETSSSVATITEKSKSLSNVSAMVTTLFLQIVGFIILLSFILNYSLVKAVTHSINVSLTFAF